MDGIAEAADAVQTQAQLTKALEELRRGVAATRHLLLQRCELREDSDGAVRAIREPQQKVLPAA